MAIAWKTSEVEYVRRWWGTLSALKIARTLGRTRNAVIGAAHRAGLPNLGNPIGNRTFKAEPQIRMPYKRREDDGSLKITAPRPRRVRVRTEEPLPLPVLPRKRSVPVISYTGTPVPFRDLVAGQCKWIAGATEPGRAHEALACAAPVAGIGCPYCAGHVDRARGVVSRSLGGLSTIDNWSTAARVKEGVG
jgi:hypothetical protein